MTKFLDAFNKEIKKGDLIYIDLGDSVGALGGEVSGKVEELGKDRVTVDGCSIRYKSIVFCEVLDDTR